MITQETIDTLLRGASVRLCFLRKLRSEPDRMGHDNSNTLDLRNCSCTALRCEVYRLVLLHTNTTLPFAPSCQSLCQQRCCSESPSAASPPAVPETILARPLYGHRCLYSRAPGRYWDGSLPYIRCWRQRWMAYGRNARDINFEWRERFGGVHPSS